MLYLTPPPLIFVCRRTQKIENYVSTYRYILEVPESHCYLPTEIVLKNRMQLAFNWSYLDNLVSTHGVHESYELSPVSIPSLPISVV